MDCNDHREMHRVYFNTVDSHRLSILIHPSIYIYSYKLQGRSNANPGTSPRSGELQYTPSVSRTRIGTANVLISGLA